MTFIANARMYAVSPEAEAAWNDLIAHVTEDADTSLSYLTYRAPRPLEQLWRRGLTCLPSLLVVPCATYQRPPPLLVCCPVVGRA